MRWTTVAIAGLGAAVVAWLSGPLFDTGDYMNVGLVMQFDATVTSLLLTTPLVIAVVGGPLAAFRALWLSTRRAELAAQIALGRPRQSLIGHHVRAGLRDGAIAAGGGTGLAALAHQVITGFDGLHLVPSTLVNYVLIVAWLVLAFTTAYWVAAAWATRGSVRDVASGQRADARAGSRSHEKQVWGRRGWFWVAGAVVFAASLAVVLGPWETTASEGRGAVQVATVTVAAVVVAMVVYLGVPAVLALWGAKGAIHTATSLSRALARPAGSGSARSFAADGLSRRTPLRAVAAAAVVAVMGVATVWTALVYGPSDASQVAEDLMPRGFVSTTDLHPSDDVLAEQDSGWAEPLPHDVLDRLHADPHLVVVEAGVLVSDHHTAVDHGRHMTAESVRDQLIAVDPAALDAVSPGAGTRLYLDDGIQWINGLTGRSVQSQDGSYGVTVNGSHTDVTPIYLNTPWAGMSRTWAEDVWGPVPTSAALLYPVGDTEVSGTLHAYDFDGLSIRTGAATYGSDGPWASDLVLIISTVPFLVIAVAIVIALAWASQRLRARDQATLLALGATPSALRGAAALESGLLALTAGAAGLIGGGLLGPVLNTVNQAPLGKVSADVLLWNLGQDLTVLPWGLLLTFVVGAAGIAAAGAALIRVRLDRRTPAEQLTDAKRAGVA